MFVDESNCERKCLWNFRSDVDAVHALGHARGHEVFTIQFETKWNPAYFEEDIQRLARHYGVAVTYRFAERGMGVKGKVAVTKNGSVTELLNEGLTDEECDFGWDEDVEDSDEAKASEYYDVIVSSG